MKAVLVGTDLMYRQDGKLVPIEINTQVGRNSSGRLEAYEDFLDFSDLKEFIRANNIIDVYLEGAVSILEKYWPEELQDVQVSTVTGFKEEYDEPGKLYVRTRYSNEALVDAFCRDKVEFLNSIKNEDFGSEFIVRTANGLEGEITSLEDNGDLPNFIVKCRYPAYDRSEYPKLLKFESLEEMNSWVDNNLEQDYLTMPFYFNEDELYEGNYGKRLKVMRNWSLFLSEDGTSLTSLDLGTYTRFTEEVLDENSREYDGNVLVEGRKQLLVGTGEYAISDLLAEKDDLILMADGTWKEVQDLEVGEEVKSVSFGESDPREGGNYGSLENLEDRAEYSTNEILRLQKIVGFYDEITLEFTDGSDWFDTENSAYPVLISENEIRFKRLRDVEVGDLIILVPVSAESEEKPSFVVKEVSNVSKERKEQEGYSLGLDGNHLFLSRTSEDNAAYIAIEHNDNNSIEPVYFCVSNCPNPVENVNKGVTETSEIWYYLPTTQEDWDGLEGQNGALLQLTTTLKDTYNNGYQLTGSYVTTSNNYGLPLTYDGSTIDWNEARKYKFKATPYIPGNRWTFKYTTLDSAGQLMDPEYCYLEVVNNYTTPTSSSSHVVQTNDSEITIDRLPASVNLRVWPSSYIYTASTVSNPTDVPPVRVELWQTFSLLPANHYLRLKTVSRKDTEHVFKIDENIITPGFESSLNEDEGNKPYFVPLDDTGYSFRANIPGAGKITGRSYSWDSPTGSATVRLAESFDILVNDPQEAYLYYVETSSYSSIPMGFETAVADWTRYWPVAQYNVAAGCNLPEVMPRFDPEDYPLSKSLCTVTVKSAAHSECVPSIPNSTTYYVFLNEDN